jgi:hypothetical protein
MKRIKLLFQPTGMFHNMSGCNIGDVLDVPDQVDADNAARYCATGLAEEVLDGAPETAAASKKTKSTKATE